MSGNSTNTGPPARRRFVPVPIETTFERYRKNGPQTAIPSGPTGEPTPSPSPQSTPPSPALWVHGPQPQERKEKRRFAPQLIESSRRSRRTGDVGPATKPTDKTDITPYHNHIYALKGRKKHRKTQSLARRESCDEETAGDVFKVFAREAEKRLLEEAALAAFPNSGARAGGAEHFAIREGSDDYNSTGASSREPTGPRIVRTTRRSRRDSYTEDVGWALREMQEYHEQLTKVQVASVTLASPCLQPQADMPAPPVTADVSDESTISFRPTISHADRVSTLELDQMNIDSPPNDPIWTTTARQRTQDSTIQPIGERYMPFIPEESLDLPTPEDGYRGIPSYARKLREAEGDTAEYEGDITMPALPRSVGETSTPHSPTTTQGKVADTSTSPNTSSGTSNIPTETGFRGRNLYAGYRNRDLFATERSEKQPHKKQSPPMLGKDIVFPKCLSPRPTKLEAEFLWNINGSMEKSHPDVATGGQQGLWHGFCFSNDKNQAMVPIERPPLLATPFPPSTPADPFAHAFGLTVAAGKSDGQGQCHNHGHSNEESSLHILGAIDERLHQENAAADLDKKIAAEFTDRFVTQVYNYLSLGYPAMARPYDEELSKISHITVNDLERDDAPGSDSDKTKDAKGHISLHDDDSHDGNYNHDSCPRWHALKLYIYEWARQHPDLDSISPQAWGMQERRGSWGL